jgi:serine/threonine protein kinase
LTSASETPLELQVGDVVGDTYIVLKYIGRGAMGHVYHVCHKVLNGEYALKTLSGDEVNEIAWKRFQMEAQAIALMRHPNVIGIYNFGLHDGILPYYAMDLLKGNDLGKKIKTDGPLEISDAAGVFVEVCAGIEYSHSKGIIHRDIKPGNIFLLETPGPTGEMVKVVDFGMVKLTQDKSQHIQSLTDVGIAVGSPNYMSPEQCMGKAVDARSDVYSIGCSLFEALTGSFPFRGRNVTEIMMAHTEAEPATLYRASGGKEFPPAIEHIIATTLAKDPAERYQSAGQLGEELAKLIVPKQPVTPAAAVQVITNVLDAPTARTPAEAAQYAATMRVRSVASGAQKRSPLVFIPVFAVLLSLVVYACLRSRQSELAAHRPTKSAPPVVSTVNGQKASEQKSSDLKSSDSKSSDLKGRQINNASITGKKAEKSAAEKDDPYPVNQIVSASLMIQKPFTTIVNEAGVDYRIFNFPTDVTIGLISTSSGGRAVRAMGQMKYRADEHITLTPADVVERYPRCLKRFKPGDIYGVRFLNDHDDDEFIEVISTIPGVQLLDFTDCWDMTNHCLSTLNKFDQLKVFRCSYSKFNGDMLPQAKCWDKLEELDLADFEKITPMLKAIKEFKQLRKLTIKGTYLTDDDFRDLAGLSKLEYLNLDGTYVTQKALKILSNMPSLTELDLSNTGIDSSSSDVLKKFKALKALTIKSAKLKPGQFEKLKENLRGMSVS